MNGSYIWHINEQGEIEVRDNQNNLIVQTGIEIGIHLMSDQNFIDTVQATFLKLICPHDQAFSDYAKSENGYKKIQEMAESLLTEHGK